MQIKINRAMQFRDESGILRTGIVREWETVGNGWIAVVTVRGLPFMVTNEQVVLRAIPHIVF